MRKLMFVPLFVFAAFAVAAAQAPLPMPQIVDHQIVSTTYNSSYLVVTENIQAAHNVVVVYLTCHYDSINWQYHVPCVYTVTDTQGSSFTQTGIWRNDSAYWEEQAFYAVIPATGSDVINATAVGGQCGVCQWSMMAEQVNGILADDAF